MNNYEHIISTINNFDAFKGTITYNEPLSNKTTFKIGGQAELFIKPENYKSFQIALDTLLANNVKFFILGGGSNVVFTDQVFQGVVLSTQDFSDVDFFPLEDCIDTFGPTTLEPNQVMVTCFSGTPMAALVNFCTKNNISGCEEFAGLPGSVGGAVFMNARCFEKSISDILFASSYMDYSLGKVKLKKALFDKNDWDYKKSPYQNTPRFITTATFLFTQKTEAEHQEIEDKCKKFINERVSKGHFLFPSAGSVFKNNHLFGAPSGKLIDQAELRGTQIGGAKIADFHGNFIINVDKATQSDVKQLVDLTQKTVYKKFGFSLETEIIFVDN